MASKRVIFVDVLRLIALAQMVNGHTLHAVLEPAVRQGEFYQGYLWFRGLVSVAFMLAAGFAFQITTLSRFEQHRADPGAVKRRVLRALEIIAIGLLLRLPLSSLLTLDLAALERGLWGLTRIDVLPCIGVSLLMLEGLVLLARSARQVVVACGVLALTCGLLAPWGASLPVHGPIAFVTGWLGPQGGSQFPLLPYAGYVFAGVVIGAIALPAAWPRLLACGGVLLAVGLLGTQLAVQRLGAVTLAIGALAYALRRVSALPRTLHILSGETLALYVFHLLVLYGEPLALHRRLGETLALGPALALSACMLLSTALFGLAWRRMKAYRSLQRALPSERTVVFATAGALCMALVLVAAQAFAEASINTNGTRYAIGGYDPVAYFEQRAPVRGKPELAHSAEGARWLFASEEHRRAFAAEPARYAPAYGGHCAFAAAQGKLVTIDPNAWSIVDGRLFLNYSLDVRAKWDAERARFIRAADAFWSKLLTTVR